MKLYTDERNERRASEHDDASDLDWAELCSIYDRARSVVNDDDDMPGLSKIGYLVRDARSSRSSSCKREPRQ